MNRTETEPCRPTDTTQADGCFQSFIKPGNSQCCLFWLAVERQEASSGIQHRTRRVCVIRRKVTFTSNCPTQVFFLDNSDENISQIGGFFFLCCRQLSSNLKPELWLHEFKHSPCDWSCTELPLHGLYNYLPPSLTVKSYLLLLLPQSPSQELKRFEVHLSAPISPTSLSIWSKWAGAGGGAACVRGPQGAELALRCSLLHWDSLWIQSHCQAQIGGLSPR